MLAPTEASSEPADRRGTFFISTRTVAIVFALLVAAACAVRALDADRAWTAAGKLILPTLVLGIVPGALATIVWRPRRRLTLLELLGFGGAMSFGLVHLLTILAITAHLGPAVVIALLAVAVATAIALLLRPGPGAIVLSVDEAIVLTLVGALGWLLYAAGSPVDTFEDQVHVAIARRLSRLTAPSLDNIYFAPGIVYTYPFPGTHYFMALVGWLGDIDILFLYQKLRFFWGPAALVMLHLAARAVFGSGAVACAVSSTAVMLILTGVFAMVPRLSWAQLVPYSHASDVAMTVLLPALLVMAFGYLQAGARRERAFFFTATSMLVVMLTSVHIREVVQFAVYVGCFLAVSLAAPSLRSYARRAASLLLLAVGVAAVYVTWHARAAAVVTDIVDSQRGRLRDTLVSSSVAELLGGSVPAVLAGFVPYFDLIWSGLTPFLLFAGPPVILLFRHRPLAWLLSSSTLAYLAVMSVPLVALPYVYLTYFEILYTPVRNIIFFVYLFAGAFVYAITVGVARIDRTRLSVLIAGALAGIAALVATLTINRTSQGFFVPLLAAYGLTFVWGWGWKGRGLGGRRIATAMVALYALAALWPEHPPEPRTAVVNVRWTPRLAEPQRAALEREFGLTDGDPTSSASEEVNVWSYRLHDLSRENVEALVTHADVVDTHHIERPTFTVPPQPPRTEYPFLGVQHVTWLQYPGWTLLIATTVFLWLLGFLAPSLLASSRGGRVGAALVAAFQEPFYRHAVPFACCLLAFGLWSARSALSPLQAGWAPDAAPTPRTMIGQMPCVTTPEVPAPFSEDIVPEAPVMLAARMACPPDNAVIEWVDRHVPVDGVFAINRWNPHLPSVFMPQQVVVFPRIERTFLEEYELFDRYYRFYEERLRRHGVQPFFNGVETPTERAAFVRALGVTHVLVDPQYYDELRPVLDGLPGQFTLEYSGGKWAVYAVVRSTPDGRGRV